MKKQDFIPRSWLVELGGGIVSGLDTAMFALALATIIYTGVLAPYLPLGVQLCLIGAAISGIVLALRATYPGELGGPQDKPAAILGSIAIAMAGSSLKNHPDRALSTMLAILVLSTLLFGILTYLLGRFRLGQFAQFMPYPVIGGFLAGTGWLLFDSGFMVMVDVPLQLDRLPELFSPERCARWVPAIVGGGLLFVLMRRFPGPVTLPATLFALLAVFYLVAWIGGGRVQQLQASGWLFGPFESPDGAVNGLDEIAVDKIDVEFVLKSLPSIATLLLLGAIATLLHLTAMEIALGQELDLDAELRATGWSNLLTAPVAGIPGYVWLSNTLLYRRAGAITRWIGIVSGLICLGIAIVGPTIIGYVPRILLGALIFQTAFDFFYEWLYESALRMAWSEYLIVLIIFGAIILVGFLQGILIGILIAVVVFVVNYSRVNPLRNLYTLASIRSSVARAPSEEAVLTAQCDRVMVLRLHGFLFFGTASTLLNEVKQQVLKLGAKRCFVLIDFRHVTGLDASTGFLFTKMKQFLATKHATPALTNLMPPVARMLTKAEVIGPHVDTAVYAHLDFALEWVENELLKEAGVAPLRMPVGEQLAVRLGSAWKAEQLLRYLEPIECRPEQHIINQGDDTAEIYFIESGYLSAILRTPEGEQIRLRKFGPGAFFGEMALYLDEKRTASIVADTECTLYRITPAALEKLAEQDPLALGIFHELLARTLAEHVVFQNRQLGTQ